MPQAPKPISETEYPVFPSLLVFISGFPLLSEATILRSVPKP
jgi:hypothetical protein